jgi:kinesin family member 6/9
VKRLEREIRDLKGELAMHDQLANRSRVSYDALTEDQRYVIQQNVRAFVLSGDIDAIDLVNIRQIKVGEAP